MRRFYRFRLKPLANRPFSATATARVGRGAAPPSDISTGRAQIDIEDHDESPTIVAQVNDEGLTGATVLLRDGSALTNPSAAQVGSRLVQVSDST
jgi:hypothetical protein